MRKLLILLLVFSLLIPCAAAAEYDGMTVLHRAWYVDGTEYVIASDSSGVPYYFVDGVLTCGVGLVFVDGYYYYVRTHGNMPFNITYWPSSTNGLLPEDNYNFDSYDRLIDPPYLPEGWESVWFDYDPTIVPPTDPTEPSVDPDEPDALPTIPGDTPINPGLTYVPSILSMCVKIISAPAGWLVSIFDGSGMTGIFLAAFLIFMVSRTLLAPVLGHSGSDTASRTRDKEE